MVVVVNETVPPPATVTVSVSETDAETGPVTLVPRRMMVPEAERVTAPVWRVATPSATDRVVLSTVAVRVTSPTGTDSF